MARRTPSAGASDAPLSCFDLTKRSQAGMALAANEEGHPIGFGRTAEEVIADL